MIAENEGQFEKERTYQRANDPTVNVSRPDVIYGKTAGVIDQLDGALGEISLKSFHAKLEKIVFDRIEEIAGNIQRLDILVNKELPARRREARFRVEQLKQDRLLLQNAAHGLQRRRLERDQERMAREELMSQKFRPNSQKDTLLQIDHALQHNSSLMNIHRGIDDILDTGVAVLDSLRSQRYTMKNTQRRILDLANTLGLSNTVMRLIERRTTQDKYLFYGLSFFTCVVIVGAFLYF
nr:EOG090X0GIP [Eulimnadia texana]